MTSISKQKSRLSVLTEHYIPQVSVDCVIFGFQNRELKVLLLKMHGKEEWALPGGFIFQDESAEDAAIRVLKERTGIDGVFLRQFHTFSDPGRVRTKADQDSMKKMKIPEQYVQWISRRFITVGFYALVEYMQVSPATDLFADSSEWCDPAQPGKLLLDHQVILDCALGTLRMQLNHQPIGYNLLEEKFTMPELQKLYESILGRKLDRRNFQRKILSYKILIKLDEYKTGVAHKAPVFYKFDTENYHKALKEGLKSTFI